MLKKIAFVLIPISMNLSVAVADSSDPMQLTPQQMDQVTAGFGSASTTLAVAISDFYAITGAQSSAITAVSGGSGDSVLGGYVEVAGGDAVAAAAGNGATTDTGVAAATSTQGMNGTMTIVSGGSFEGSFVEFTSGAIITGGDAYNPFY